MIKPELQEKLEHLLDQQLDMAIGVGGLISADTAQAIANLCDGYAALTDEDE